MEETSQFVPNNYGIQNIYYGTVINVYYNEYRMCDSAYSTCRESTTVEDDEIFEEDAPQEGKTVDYDALVSKCFTFPSEFTKWKVEAVMNNHYQGSHAELALIEVTLYDHGQLKRRNAHTAFIRALEAWGLIKIANEEEFEQIRKGITDKFGRIPNTGYKNWADELLNDRTICEKIGKQLGDTMPYVR